MTFSFLPLRPARASGPRFILLTALVLGPAFGSRPIAAAEARGQIDLSGACLVLPGGLTAPEKKAAAMLIDEIGKRSQIRWPVAGQLPAPGQPAVVLGPRTDLLRDFPALAPHLARGENLAEGYQIFSFAPGLVVVAGNDARGVLFGAGRLLRLLDYARAQVTLAAGLALTSAPRYPLRGHQLGYRPKTNSYDGWDVAMWEQYVRDLVVFGANAIEGIPPRSDDDPDSPHFTLPPLRMMAEQSRLAQEYGIDYWVWYPALDANYADPAVVAAAVKEWGAVLRALPKVDAVFVPGGDPGHTAPKDLFPLLEQQAAQLQRLHPGAKMWMSPQGFTAAGMDDFYRLLQAEPAWLEGIVFGPQQRESLEELRARVPRRYKLRLYPDITHTLAAQFPVTAWDVAFAATLNREPINPRPIDEAAIFHRLQPLAADGVLTYSEGCNDDVNKCVWSSLAWNPDADVTDILRDYSRYFIGDQPAEQFAQGLLALERNWRGSPATNDGIDETLRRFQALEQKATPAMLQNWRFQQGLYRAYYDATVRARLMAETAREQQALAQLSRASTLGSAAAMAAATAALEPPAVRPAAEWRARVFELAEALFQSIHMQLSVPRYQAKAVNRGANLDLIDTPLTDAPWLREQFAAIAKLPAETDRRQRLDAIVHWNDAGPGGFYDDLGRVDAQPHLVQHADYAADPAGRTTPISGFGLRHKGPARRISSADFAETLHDEPLELHYEGLDRAAHYRVRVIYGNEVPGEIRLVANRQWEICPLQPKDLTARPLEFDVPPAVTAGGDLRLTWSGAPGRGGNGRGVQVAEVWLLRAP